MEVFAGRFTLLRSLGRGGMGHVWLAVDRTSGRECALKRLDADLPRAEHDSLRREFEVLARVRHPSLVAAHELGFAPDGTPYYTMEYVPGEAADRALGPGDWPAFHACAIQLAHALEALHAAGVVHGDVKPSNVLVVRDARGALADVRLLDLGLAALLGRDRKGHRGTPGYAAPEVVAGSPSSIASDLHAFGATLYVLALGCAAPAREPGTGPRPPQARTDVALVLEEAAVPAELVRLVLRLLAPDPAARPSSAREVRLALERLHPAAKRSLRDRLRHTVVVGRQNELARLERWLASAPGESPLLFLTGEPGTGRSSLLDEISARASLAGHPVVRIEPATLAPGEALHVVLRRLAVERPADSPREDAADALLRRLDDPTPGGLDLHAHEATALRWAEEVRRTRRALLVCVDDAERLDTASSAHFRRLALHPEGGAIRWIWSLPAGGRLAEPDRLLLESRRAEHVALAQLDRAGTHALVHARLYAEPPRELVEVLWERTGGHPGLVVETLRAAAAARAIEETEAGIAVHPHRLEQLTLPADFEMACLARLDALGPGAAAAAAALAVWGRPLAEADLRRIEPEVEASSLAALEDAGLLVRDAAGNVRPSPPGLVRVLLARIDPKTRVRLHRGALEVEGLSAAARFAHLAGAGETAAALAEADRALAEGADVVLAIEAAQVAAAEAPEVACRWEDRAGQMLVQLGRYREAIAHLDRADALDHDGAARGSRWFLMSGACFRTGQRERNRDILARGLAARLSDSERARLLVNEHARLVGEGDLEGAEASGLEALALAERASDGEAEALAAMSLGSLRRQQGRIDDAVRLAGRAEMAGERAGYVLGRLRATALRALCVTLQGEALEAERISRAALVEARARGTRLAQLELAANLAWVLSETGRWSESLEVMEEPVRVALQEGWPGILARALVNRSLSSSLTGRVAGGVREARIALGMARRYQPMSEALAWRAVATACRVTGRLRSAVHAGRRAVQSALALGEVGELAWCRHEFGRACAARGGWADAGSVWERGFAEASGDLNVSPILAAAHGRAALRAGAMDLAARRLASAESWITGRQAPYVMAHVQQLRAELAMARGQSEAGHAAADAALRTFAELPAPPDAAAAALEFARVATRSGIAGRVPVADWLRTAATGFERLGDHRQRERALALAVNWYRRHGGTTPGGKRDRDLLELVTRLLDSQPDLGELSRRAMQLAVDQLDAERGVLVLADETSGEPRPVVEHGAVDAATRDQALSYSREIVARVSASGGSLLVGDLTTEPESLSRSMVELGLRSVLCVPLFVSGRVVGAVYLDDSRRAQAFGDTERGLLEGFAHLLAVAIENSRGHDRVRRANEQLVGENLSLRREVSRRFQPRNFIGTSQAMQRVLAIVERAAVVPSTVLITGENGTGKELVARMLHYAGPRAMHPFVAVNCGAIAPTLLESELFGILADVATGVRARAGRFVEAHRGTLFLDEIGDMPLAHQVALLSVLANRKVTPIGGGKAVEVDVRVIAATNRDLPQRIADGTFREDLWYRLNVVPIEMPPLRDRKADIPALAQHFAAMFAAQQGRDVPELSPGLLAVLMQSDWPGNVRELQNYIERLMAMDAGRTLHPRPLPHDLERRARGRVPHTDRSRPLGEQVAELERRQVLSALERNLGNQSRAASELGLTEQALRYRLKKYGIARKKGRVFRRIR